MFIGGQTGTPRWSFYGEILPMKRTLFEDGQPLLKAALLHAAYRPPGVKRQITIDSGGGVQSVEAGLEESLWPESTASG